MEDMDFTKPHVELPAAITPYRAAASRFYDAAAAATVFRACGKQERFAAGEVLFEEAEKATQRGDGKLDVIDAAVVGGRAHDNPREEKRETGNGKREMGREVRLLFLRH